MVEDRVKFATFAGSVIDERAGKQTGAGNASKTAEKQNGFNIVVVVNTALTFSLT